MRLGRRRSYPWVEIARLARSTPGVWRNHPALIAVTPDLLAHARRRVRALRPTDEGWFEWSKTNAGQDDLGRTVMDLHLRWTPKGPTA